MPITISHQQSGNQNPRSVKAKKCAWRCGETVILVHCFWDWKMVQLIWKSSFPQNDKHSYFMAQQVHSHYISRDLKACVLTKTYT